MKFTKKLLTVLPIAAIGGITPVVVSGCACSNGFTISYGDSINCKNKDGKNYHSIDQIKETSKSHIQIFPEQKIAENKLKNWSNTTDQQFFYWDLIYSVANSNIAFTLTWKLDDLKTSTQEVVYNGNKVDPLSYAFNGDGKVEIRSGSTTIITSYAYSKVEKA